MMLTYGEQSHYYPKKMEFRVDSNNDGRFDTVVGYTDKLGPAERCIGKHMFSGRLPLSYGLEIRVLEQNVAGAKRAWTMNEMKLIVSTGPPIIKTRAENINQPGGERYRGEYTHFCGAISRDAPRGEVLGNWDIEVNAR